MLWLQVQEALDEASKTELGKKAGQIGEELSKSAKEAADTISEKSQAFGKTGAFQTISQTAEAVRQELDQHGIQGRVYVPLKKLRKRKETPETPDDREYQVNTEAMGVELHKDSKFYQSWQNFKVTIKDLRRLKFSSSPIYCDISLNRFSYFV